MLELYVKCKKVTKQYQSGEGNSSVAECVLSRYEVLGLILSNFTKKKKKERKKKENKTVSIVGPYCQKKKRSIKKIWKTVIKNLNSSYLWLVG